MQRVQILLSTFNGAKYLPAQIESIISQDYPNIEIVIRDDGSQDQTPEILTTLCKNLPYVRLSFENNIGAIASFQHLLAMAAPDSGYYAFCDQDDVWLPDKISCAVESISAYSSEVPILYCSRLIVADDTLNHRHIMPRVVPRPSFPNSLIESLVTGCTVVMNQAACKLITYQLPNPSDILMHDWWAYLVISCFGTIIYDPVPHMIYRQHMGNAIGTRSGGWIARVNRFSGLSRGYVTQAKEFRRLFGDRLPAENKQILDRFLFKRSLLLERIMYAFTGEAYRNSWLDNLIFRVLILMDRI